MMEETELIKSSKIVDDEVTAQYVPTRSVKTYHLMSNTLLAIVLFAVCLRIVYKQSFKEAFFHTVSAVAFFTVVLGLSEMGIRLFHCLMELTQLNGKYEGDVGQVFASFNLNTPSWIFLVSSFVIFVILHLYMLNTVQHIWHHGAVPGVLALVTSVILCQLTGMRDSTMNTALAISSMGGVDYGTGMAYSYFYGYLKLVLPSDGSYNKGLRDKMVEWETNQNVTIPVKKLFILIPESGHIPPDLKEASNNWLESTTKLESVVKDRAGVRDRKYSNTVYKIHPGGEGKDHRPVYVTTEGATPMLTFWEILQHAHPQTAAYRNHRKQIVASFYETLKMLLNNDLRCRDVCELVFYDDYDATGRKVNVGEILLKRIRAQAATSV